MTLVTLLSQSGRVTGTARLSLATVVKPGTQTNHVISIRARVTAGAGRMRAALYQGNINRSGLLETAPLSGSFVTYTLPISDVNAAKITGYTNLEIQLYGFATIPAGGTFQVAEVSLVIPTGTAGVYIAAPDADSGRGVDTAAVSAGSQVSASDFGIGTDSASVSSSVTSSTTLPSLSLEVSFDADSGPAYFESVVVSAPKVYYRLDEGVAAPEVQDQMHNMNMSQSGGVVRSQTSLLPGDPNTCFDFQGSGALWFWDYAGILDTDLLTVECVCRPDSVTYGMLASRYACWLFVISGGHPTFGAYVIEEGVTRFVSYTSNAVLSTATTYHLAVAVRETSVDFYVDGVLVDSLPKSWTQLYKSTDAQISILLSVGAHWDGSAMTYFYDGKLDEVAVYLRDLPTEEISYHSQARQAITGYTWTQVSGEGTSSYLQALTTKRGAQDIYREPETGIFTGNLYNNSRRFDPGNTSSPFYPTLKPARPIRLTANKDGILYTVFRGDVEDWPQAWKGRDNEVPITALDAFDVLAGVEITLTRPEELSGTRVHAILNAVGWSQELRLVDAGEEFIAAVTGQTGNAKSLLIECKNAESGQVFVDGQGRVVFQERNSRFTPPYSSVKATFSNVPGAGEFPFVNADAKEDKDQIKNHVRIKVTDSVLVGIAQDAQSILDHRKRTHEEELPLTSLTSAEMRAGWILSLFRNPFQRISDVILEPQMDPNLWVHVLGREIGDRIRFKIFPPGKPGTMLDLQATIEYIEHRYIASRWTTLWKMSPADTNDYWILGSDNLDSGTKIAY